MKPYQVQPIELPSCLEPAPTIAGAPCLRFRSSRTIRRLEVECPFHLLLTVHGRPVCLIEPGSNLFDPPLELHSGDPLQIEELEQLGCTGVVAPPAAAGPDSCGAPGEAKPGDRIDAPGYRIDAPGDRIDVPGDRIDVPGDRIDVPQGLP